MSHLPGLCNGFSESEPKIPFSGVVPPSTLGSSSSQWNHIGSRTVCINRHGQRGSLMSSCFSSQANQEAGPETWLAKRRDHIGHWGGDTGEGPVKPRRRETTHDEPIWGKCGAGRHPRQVMEHQPPLFLILETFAQFYRPGGLQWQYHYYLSFSQLD